MTSLSKIDQFLAEQSREGSLEGDGAFSLAPDKALQKIAQYQRAFPEVWLVKVIQAAVVGKSALIKVKLTRQAAVIEFSLDGLSPDRLEQAFHEPRSSGDEALDNLLLGLWYISLGRDYPFTLNFPEHGVALSWDGDRFHRATTGRASALSLTVPHLRVGQVCGWIDRRRVVAERCLELSRCLEERCYTCSVPLTLDGRRLDTLMGGQAPPGAAALPVLHELCQSEKLPVLSLPQGSYEGSAEPRKAALVWTLFVNFHAKGGFWRGEWTQCGLTWVQHGVVVHRESLHNPSRSVSLEIVASAEGLQTDVSGFRMVDNELLTQRRRAVTGLAFALVLKAEPDFKAALSVLKAKDARESRLLPTLGGLVLLPILPPFGVMFLMNAWGPRDDREATRHLLNMVTTEWTHLKWDLEAS